MSLHAKTGYGRISRDVLERLLETGYDVIAMGHESDVTVWGAQKPYHFDRSGKDILNLTMTNPLMNRQQATSIVSSYCRKYHIDYLIGLWDVWALPFLSDVGRPFATYIPIDSDMTQRWADYAHGANRIIAMSKFGYQQLRRFYADSEIAYVPHGVDVETFKPLGIDKDELRRELPCSTAIPDGAFLMVCVQANVGPRKLIPLMLRTFAKFVRAHPDAHLYLHSNVLSDIPQGYNIPEFVDAFGIKDHVHWPFSNPILEPASDEDLNKLYNAGDVYVTNAIGEGFGLPILEAQSAGIPIIAPDNSAMTELVKGKGWLVKMLDEEEYVDYPLYVPTDQRNIVPSQKSMLECMEAAYSDVKSRRQFAEKARESAMWEYSWDKVMPAWFRLLDAVTEETTWVNQVKDVLRAQP